MFYSQFILAKKGPLGTIWIAAHLERKLRKNQVADTDIGVSVDSILFPDVPIALRLSSHLLLGVVRIYSRKVNYLFDDCSEALLKIKQAFRSTAVDLPPEESTAPYHSITLPETFDLDDFELPDNDIFQGNYVDHHISTREQITLQDTMEGVVYSTSQFGLDERFGDGDTSQIGLDLDEDLFLDKVSAPGHAGVLLGLDAADPQASVHPIIPLQKDVISEATAANDIGNQIEDLAASADVVDYAQAPSTPGLVEEPNLSSVQEALASDDHLEPEDHNLTELAAKENLENASSVSSLHYEDSVAADWSLLNDTNHDAALSIPADENGCILSEQKIKQAKPPGDSPSVAVMEQTSSEYSIGKAAAPDGIDGVEDMQNGTLSNNGPSIDGVEDMQNGTLSNNGPGIDGVEDMQNGTLSNNGPGIDGVEDMQIGTLSNNGPGIDGVDDMQIGTLSNNGPIILSVDQTHEEFQEPHELDETVGNLTFSHSASDLESPCHRESPGTENTSEKSLLTTSCPPALECISENDKASLDPDVSASNAVCSYESPVRPQLENVEDQALNSVIHDELPPCSVDVVQACDLHLIQTDSSLGEAFGREEEPHAAGVSADVQGEMCHATGVLIPLLEENQISIPTSNENIETDRSKLDEQMDNVISSDTQLLKSSTNSDLPAPEKLLSMPEGLIDPPNDLLVELTPDKVLEGSEEDGAAMKNISGKKRSFTESTLTVHSLNSVETFGVSKWRKTAESIPDDDDLLSSILVGRRSSALKMKPTPPPPEVASMKRPRTATRSSASKRKVLMDDPMVLHGDTIRQQLTSTEDIRRIRKKAPCTRLEIWMIRKQFLEDEIFSEPLSTGMSAEFMSLYNESYDLSRVRVFENAENNASSEASKEMGLSVTPNVTKENGEEGSIEYLAVGNDGEKEPAHSLVQTENQHGEDHSLSIHDNNTQVKTLQTEFVGGIAEMEIDRQGIAVADASDHGATHGVDSFSTVGPISGDICDLSAGSMFQSTLMEETHVIDPAQLMDELFVSSLNERLDANSIEKDASAVDLSNGIRVDTVEVEENNNDDIVGVGSESRQKGESVVEETVGIQTVETGVEIHTACAAPVDTADSSLATVTLEASGCSNLVVVAEDQTPDEISNNKSGIVNDVEVLDAELSYDDKNPTSNIEEPKIECSYTIEIDEEMKNAFLNEEGNIPLNDIEKPVFPEAEPHTAVDTEFTAVDHSAIEDHGDFGNTMFGNDTEFLNVDDDDVADDDDYMPSAEENRFLENSGWSSRTRAVANYLQTLFDKEAEHGKKVIPINNLLAGKTRKEASRMFFETLVLKTRDYIQVEQENPFDNIKVKPRAKLMKSDF